MPSRAADAPGRHPSSALRSHLDSSYIRHDRDTIPPLKSPNAGPASVTVLEELPTDSRLYHRRRPSFSNSPFPRPLSPGASGTSRAGSRSVGVDMDDPARGMRGATGRHGMGMGRPGYGPPPGELIPRDYGPPEGPNLDAIPPHLMGIGPWSDRPPSSRAGLSTASGDHRGESRGGRWSPTLPGVSPRFGSQPQHRLPSLSDLQRTERDRWDGPPSTDYSSRPPTSYADDRRFHPAPGPGPFAHQPPFPQFTSTHPGIFDARRVRGREDDFTEAADARLSGQEGQSPMTTAAEDKEDEAKGDGPGSNKKKKRRVALSCAECAKRKQKCNRETPCQHCVSRRVPELCVPYARGGSPTRAKVKDVPAPAREDRVKTERPGTASGADSSSTPKEAPTVAPPRATGMLPTLSVRVTRIEAMLNAVLNRVDGVEGKALNDWRINHAPASSPPPMDAAPADTTDSPISARSRAETAIERAISPEGEAEPGDVHGLDMDTSTRNPLPQALIRPSDPMHLRLDYHGTPAERLSNLFSELGMDTAQVSNLLSELPAPDMMTKLVDHFFKRFNFVRYPISEYLFRQNLASLYADRSVNPTAVLAMPLVFIVFAIASRCAPNEWFEDGDSQRRYSLKMYWNSRNAVIVSSAIKTENLTLVETRICTGLYLILMHERRLAEGWTEMRAAITTGQAIGLHRDGTKLGLDRYMIEYRRRLWSYLVHANSTYSCILGRPMSIDTSCCDTLPPSNIDLRELAPDDDIVVTGDTVHPFSTPSAEAGEALPDSASSRSKRSRQKDPHIRSPDTPTFATYLILRRRLGEIVAMITQNFQQLRGHGAHGSYKEIERIGDEMKRFVADLPRCYRMEDPDKSLDKDIWYLPTHRYYIQTEILHFTIILHRPWFLRKLNSNRYLPSRLACFEAAVLDHKIRKAFAIEVPGFLETLLSSSFRAFNSAMIAGLSLILDPNNQHAKDMREIVQSFMQQHPHDPAADEFSQKEAAIISTLHKRAEEVAEKQSRVQYRFDVRSNVSNERGTPAMSAAGSRDDEQAEEASKEPEVRQPAPQSESMRSSIPVLSNMTDRVLNKSPVKHLLNKERGSLGSSPDEFDHSQRLLDQWLMSTTSFGPGSDGTMNPFITTALPSAPTYQPSPYGQPTYDAFVSPAISAPSTMPDSGTFPPHWQSVKQFSGGSLPEAALGLGPSLVPSQAPYNPQIHQSQGIPSAPMSAPLPTSHQPSGAPYGFPGVPGGMMGGAEPLIGQPIQHGLDTTRGLQGMGAGNGMLPAGPPVGADQVQWAHQMGMQPGEGVGAYWNTLIDGIMGQGM